MRWFSRLSKENGKRHVAKAVGYRIFASYGVTPFLASVSLYIKTHWHLTATEFIIILATLEFVAKLPAYVVFETITSHILWGYRNGN